MNNKDFIEKQLEELQQKATDLQKQFFEQCDAKDSKAQESLKLFKGVLTTYAEVYNLSRMQYFEGITAELKPASYLTEKRVNNVSEGTPIGRYYKNGREIRIGDYCLWDEHPSHFFKVEFWLQELKIVLTKCDGRFKTLDNRWSLNGNVSKDNKSLSYVGVLDEDNQIFFDLELNTPLGPIPVRIGDTIRFKYNDSDKVEPATVLYQNGKPGIRPLFDFEKFITSDDFDKIEVLAIDSRLGDDKTVVYCE